MILLNLQDLHQASQWAHHSSSSSDSEQCVTWDRRRPST